MKEEFHFASACRFWGYKPHELANRKDREWLVAQSSMLQSAENQAQEIAADIAKKQRG